MDQLLPVYFLSEVFIIKNVCNTMDNNSEYRFGHSEWKQLRPSAAELAFKGHILQVEKINTIITLLLLAYVYGHSKLLERQNLLPKLLGGITGTAYIC